MGQTWRTQGWGSYRLNRPGRTNRMLGEQAPDACTTVPQTVHRLEKLAATCPGREGVRVVRLTAAGDGYRLRTDNALSLLALASAAQP